MTYFTRQSGVAVGLALSVTAVSLVLSASVAWQRGTSWSDRSCGVAIATIIVLGTHLLPTINARLSGHRRVMTYLLWLACSLMTLHSHATFVLQSQARAGDARADSVSVAPVAPTSSFASARSLTQIAAEDGDARAQLVRLEAQRCTGPCTWLAVQRTTLNARIEKLARESEDIQRSQSAQDRLLALAERDRDLRDSAREEPVLQRLAAVLKVSMGVLELCSAVLVAVVVEGLACLLWYLWMHAPSANADATSEAIGPGSPVVVLAEATVEPAVTTSSGDDSELARVIDAVADGSLRPRVTDIRAFLNCAQSYAVDIRQQLPASLRAR